MTQSNKLDCNKIMCKAKLYTKKNSAKWLLRHHPDKGGQPASLNVGSVGTCMKNKHFCTRKNGVASPRVASPRVASPRVASPRVASPRVASLRVASLRPSSLKSINRVFQRVKHSGRDAPEAIETAYKPNNRQLECVRQVSNWSKITPSNRFNKSRFDIVATDKLIPIASPKLEALLQNIAALDANDMTLHGKNFKHFIFSDIKFLGYGAKIISAAFIARGFRPVLKFEKSRIVVDVPQGPGTNFAVLSSTALWDSPFKHKLKKSVLDMFNKRPDNVFGQLCRFIILDSGFKEGIDLFDVRYVHLFEPLMTEADYTQALGRATRLCGQKGLDFVPNVGWPLNVYKYNQSIPEKLQDSYKAKNLFEITLQLKGLDSRLHNISKAIKDVSILAAVDQPLTESIHKSGLSPRLVVKTPVAQARSTMTVRRNTIDMTDELTRLNLSGPHLLEDSKARPESISEDPCADCYSTNIVPFAASRISSRMIKPKVIMDSNELLVVPSIQEYKSTSSSLKVNSWYSLRNYIVKKFSSMAWPEQQVINKCLDKPTVAPVKKDTKNYIVPPKKQSLPLLNLVDYTPTQKFISQYFTASSPIKGMLLWHSVGTGKTCSAIALASTQFEPKGYTIIWVTRHTLKADIWKNVFDFVCHKTIAEEVRNGQLAPEDVEKRKRVLGQQWIPPMSYRQFSNLVQGKNPLYEVLKKRNGKEDPLAKTLIIIDEAHKLYSSDFKGAEKPDVPAFNAALQNSYAVSGQNSARVLLMTATPYNESPMELMSLLNLCRLKSDALPSEMSHFIETYMDSTGNFTQTGLKTYMDAIAGQISYLNREADPSQFAQPIFAEIVVPISTYDSVSQGDSDEILQIKRELAGLVDEKKALEDEIIPHLKHQIDLIAPTQEAKVKECNELFKIQPKDLKACMKRVTVRYKDGLKLEERNLRDAIKRAEKIDKLYLALKKKTENATKKMNKTGLSILSQQAQLETRCKIGAK